jgi:hypothetical protein
LLRTSETLSEILGTNYYLVPRKAFEQSRKEPEVAESLLYERWPPAELKGKYSAIKRTDYFDAFEDLVSAHLDYFALKMKTVRSLGILVLFTEQRPDIQKTLISGNTAVKISNLVSSTMFA